MSNDIPDKPYPEEIETAYTFFAEYNIVDEKFKGHRDGKGYGN
jgi:hypothetical protein